MNPSTTGERRKITIATLRQMRARGEKIAFLTAYDFVTARLQDRAGIEMILVGERAGLSHDIMKKCLGAGSVQGTMFSTTAPRLFERDFAPRGAVEIFVKDMGVAIDLAKECGVDLQIVPAARKMFQRAEAAGWGKDDASRVIEVYEGKDKDA